MNSSFKFLRRVRIHGGECGAVARALHHEAKIQSLPAVKGNVFFTTYERKSMSTKTIFKRIALIAVSALSFGLFTSAPSQAVYDVNKTSLSVSAVGRVGVGVHILVSAGYGGTESKLDSSSRCHAKITSAPSTAGILAPEQNQGYGVAATDSFTAFRLDSVTVTTPAVGSYAKSTDVCYIVLGQTSGQDTYTAGTYTFLVWVDTIAGATKTPTAGTSVSSTVSVTLGGAPSAFELASTSATLDSSAQATQLVEATIKDAAGVATILDSVADGGTETFTVASGGTGWEKALIADTNTARSGTVPNSAIDSALATTNHAKFNAGARDEAVHSLWSKIRFYVGSSSSSTTTFTIRGGANLAAVSSGAFTLTMRSSAVITNVQASSGTRFSATRADARGSDFSMGVVSSAYAFPAAVTSGTEETATATTLYASTATGKTVNFEITTSAAGTVRGSVAAVSTTTPLPAGVSAGAFDYVTDTVTTVKSFTATAPLPGDAYAVTFNFGDGKSFTYNVTYQAPTVASGVGSITTNIDSSPRVAVGSTNSIVVTVLDQFEQPAVGAIVRMTQNRTATGVTSAAVSETTGTAGTATFSVADVFAGTTTVSKNSAGTFTFTVNTPNASSSLAPSARTLNYTTASFLTPGAITITEDANDDDTVGNVVDAAIAETITVTTETGLAMSGVAYSATLSSGLYEDATTSVLTGFTDANGKAKVVVSGYKTGVQTITFTVGALSASDTFTVVSATTKLRALAVDKATLAVNSGNTEYVTVTATDIYGNAVPSASVTVTYLGVTGRIVSYNGAQGNSATTDANGKLVIGIYAEGTGTGTLTAEYANASQATTTGQGIAPVARVTKVTTAVTTSGVSPAVAAAEAATDAAAEAIDAANAATDAANLAAEAADAATVAAEEARDAADAATAAVEELATQVATLMAALKAQITTLANTVAKIAKKVKA